MVMQVAKAASMSLNNCVNCLPGLREVDEIVKHVSTVSVKLSTTAQVCFVTHPGSPGQRTIKRVFLLLFL